MTDDIDMSDVLSKIDKSFGSTIDCDKGWFPIIKDIDQELTKVDPGYVIYQIKEKFGSLRYYFAPSRPDLAPEMYAIVEKHCLIADQTCEVTGKPGVLMVGNGPISRYKRLAHEFNGNGWTIVEQPVGYPPKGAS